MQKEAIAPVACLGFSLQRMKMAIKCNNHSISEDGMVIARGHGGMAPVPPDSALDPGK